MSWLADAVLALHLAYVAFVLGGLLLIWVGRSLDWQWTRNWWFRLAHLAAIVLVAVEAVAGITCPLTWLEDALRGVHAPSGFLERWLHAILFWDFPLAWFTAAYLAVAALTAYTFWRIPPVRSGARRQRPG